MPLDQIEDEIEMTFLDHLEELRWHLIRSLAAIMVFAVAAFFAKTLVFHTILLGPSRVDFWTYEMLCKLSDILKSEALCIDELPFIIQSRKMTGQFSMHVTSSFVIGIICAFPYAFWEIWRFIKPGLYPRERKAARGATFFVSLLFILGVVFGYFIVTPISINFLSNYQLDPTILNEFDIISYISTVITLVLACGILFQLPIVVYFLTKAGLITPQILRTYRRHAIIVILILGAMLTPPDPFSQILIAIPLLGLYQVSIYISARVIKKEATTEIQKVDE
ncbi:twin-arginine translocase subunit TatC [Marinoscillum sp.]|uniref:twin-arginine translocase subunit TatC n=1 Tax=Marinoscillum sp. TaxID=2024838 RepID=UPI003BAA3394